MSADLQTFLPERVYYAAAEQSDPPFWFRPLLPALPGSPPDYPGYGTGACPLNPAERAEVDRYLLLPTDEVLSSLRLPDAIAMCKLLRTYRALPAFMAWSDACHSDTRSEWKKYLADSMFNAKGTLSKSADATGVGSGAPPAAQPVGGSEV